MTAREIYTQLVGAGFKRLPVPQDDDGKEDEEAAVWLHKGRLKVILTKDIIRIQQFGTEQDVTGGYPVVFAGYRIGDIDSMTIDDDQLSVFTKHSWLI